MAEICGDNLVAARRFMNLCRSHMREIFSGGTLPLSDVIARLGDIQSQAKIMHARAIYKAAQTIIDDLTKRCSVQSCAGSVLVLQRLIRQYEAGLNEVMPKTVTTATPIQASASSKEPISLVSDSVRQKQAADILKPLVKFADPVDQDSLVRLLSFAANDQATKPKSRLNKIDVIMPGLTNHLLRLARTEGKSVSISYASDDSVLGETILKLIQSQLELTGQSLLQYCVKTPKERLEGGQSQSAHLAITSRTNGKGLTILMSCDGASQVNLSENTILKPLAELGVQSLVNESDAFTRFEILGIPLSIVPTDHAPLMEAAQ